MTIMYPGDSQPERVPAVFDDRVIFGYPDQSRPPPPPPPKGGGSMGAVLAVFAVMLIPCAILGYLVWNMSNEIGTIKADAEKDSQAQITRLTDTNVQLTAAVADRDKTILAKENEIKNANLLIASFSPIVRSLLDERQVRVDRIAVLLSSGDNGADQLPANLRNMPVWDTSAVAILTDHNDKLKAFEDNLRRKLNAPPAPPIQRGTIGAGATEIAPGRPD
jgi:flagellar basal body-associated protein FliL